MKKAIIFILAVFFCFTLTACEYSESEKRDIARKKIISDVETSIMTGTMLKYGVRDVDLRIAFFEKDQNTTVTVTEGNADPIAYRIKGTYYLDGIYIGEFEGVYVITFFKGSKEIGPLHQQTLRY